MSAQPISVRIVVGDQVGSIELVGDPSDGMLALQVGRAVSTWMIEQGSRPIPMGPRT